MKELKELQERMERERPHRWEDFPDLALYMDQVLAYMPRQLIDLGETETLTSAMVNNYIKEGLLPRATGKKYNRVHLAYLTAICAMKQVISVKEAHRLIQAGEERAVLSQPELAQSPQGKTQVMYEYLCEMLDQSMKGVASAIDPETSPEDLSLLALRLALNSYANQLACRRVLEMLGPESPHEGKKEKKAKKAKEE